MSTERRVTFAHFDYTGGANGVPVESPDGDWQFESMTWLPEHGSREAPRKRRRRREIRDSTALHGLLLIMWRREQSKAAREEQGQ